MFLFSCFQNYFSNSKYIIQKQSYRKHQMLSMIRRWSSDYKRVTKLEQTKYQLNFTSYDDIKNEYVKLNNQLSCFLEIYQEKQHLFRHFFRVKRIKLNKKVRLSERIKLMKINWQSLQQLVIYDDNNWFGWLQDFSFVNPVFQNDEQNMKKVEFHLDFLFPQYIELLSKSSFTFKVEIYIKYMTQQTFLMFKQTKFINPDKINIIFKFNKVQIEQVIRLEKSNEKYNYNLQILQQINLHQVYFFYSLMQLDMNTFYNKCAYIKKEYLLSLQLSQDLVDIWDVYIQNISIQDRLKQIYKLNSNDLFELQISKKMKSQSLFIKFEWNEVYKITFNNVESQDNQWSSFYQNSHNFSNLIALQFDFPYSQLQLVGSEHFKKFKELKYLIIAQGIQCKKKYSKDQMEEKQQFEIKKNNRLKSFYELNLKLPILQFILQYRKFQFKRQIHFVKELLYLLFDSTQQIRNFQKWIHNSLKVTLEYKEFNADENQVIEEQMPSHIINLEQKLANAIEIFHQKFFQK